MLARSGKDFSAVAFSLALGACQNSGAGQIRARERAASWLATARTVASAWNRHEVSTSFARSALDEARSDLTSLLRDLDPSDRRQAEQALELVSGLREALLTREESRVRTLDDPLAAAERSLRRKRAM
jgi:hypothetical protein